MKTVLFFSVLFLSLATATAQNQGNIWYFGNNAGLDFNGGSPVPLLNSAMATNEGCASIANSLGQLLFYTDGTYIWDRTHNMMPATLGGILTLGGDASSTQSAIIIPKPGSTTIYYVFTVDAQAGLYSGGSGGLNMNIVDMTLNGGLGDLTTINQNILTPTCEKVTATRMCNGHDFWVVTHQWNSNSMYAYPLTAAGLGVPVISSVGVVHQDVGSLQNAESIGYMKFSPNGSKLAVAAWENLNTVQIFDFNNSTGVISNPITDTNYPNVSGSDGPYGVSFSPDGTKLYVGGFGSVPTASTILQYNMSAGSPAAILASRTVIYSEYNYGVGAFQIGPDGKIYITKSDGYSFFGTDSLDVINNPNAAGLACGFVFDALYLGNSGINTGTFGLPDIVESFLIPPVSATITYPGCSGSNSYTFTDSLSGVITYHWNFGDPSSGTADTSSQQNPTHTFSSQGNFTVTLIISNPCGSDTFTHVMVSNNTPVTINAGPDVTLCPGDSVLLTASGAPNGSTYLWTPSAGLGCTTCAATHASPAATTTYIVTATAPSGCSDKDTVIVTLSNQIVAWAQPDTAVCPGQSVQLLSGGGATYHWVPAGGLSNPNIPNPIATPASTTSYTVTVSSGTCAPSSATATVTVLPLPTLDAGPDAVIQLGSSTQLQLLTSGVSFNWSPSTGLSDPTSSSPLASPMNTTTYIVTTTDANGCISSDSVTVFVVTEPYFTFPNAFSPNGDGINDIFRSHYYQITTLDLKIFNRWGQLIFETDKPELGWDGTFKGVDQTIGVYVYEATGVTISGTQIFKKGNVTLLR